MSSQADVRSIEALKEFRVALALYAEEALGALGAVKMEARRTVQWVQHDRKTYWTEQIKRRREAVASARSEVVRRRLAKTPEHTPAMSEQKELLRNGRGRAPRGRGQGHPGQEVGADPPAGRPRVPGQHPPDLRPRRRRRPPGHRTCSAGWSTPWKPTSASRPPSARLAPGPAFEPIAGAILDEAERRAGPGSTAEPRADDDPDAPDDPDRPA